jgi:hypothetical protein
MELVRHNGPQPKLRFGISQNHMDVSMQLDLLPKILVPSVILIILGLFRRIAPPQYRAENWRFDERQVPEPLPVGVIGGAMWALGIGLCLTFFILRGANYLWSSFEGPTDLTQYAPQAIGCFFP